MPKDAITPEPPPRPQRRLALKILSGLGLAGVAGGAFAFTPRGTNAYYSGPVTDHFDGVRFFNPGGPKPKSLLEVARWQLGSRAEAWPAAFPSPIPQDQPPPRVDGAAVRVTFIGHASYLIQIEGLNILFDPVFSERASPVQFAGPKRVNAPGIDFARLPKIDLILVSHNHYDHLDTDTIGRLWQRDRPLIITPLGNDAIIAAAQSGVEATAIDWGDRRVITPALTIDCVPTQHWSARGTRDRMHALWASFVLVSSTRRVYLVGDSGFGDGRTFRDVAARHPKLDLACLPIGAYEPQWLMRDQHMNPAEAVQAFLLSGAQRAVGHHWGTFKLTNEAVDAPRIDLANALQAATLSSDRFKAVQPGDVIRL